MKIQNKEYRIVKKVYGDGHEEYHAEQRVLNLFFFGIWKDYVYKVTDYGFGAIVYKYRFSTYDECLDCLVENIEYKTKLENHKKVKSKSIYV